MNIGKAITQTREEKGLTKAQLATKTGYKWTAIHKLENKPLVFQLIPLYTVADALEIKLSQLIERAESL